jgi:hypothetical protein
MKFTFDTEFVAVGSNIIPLSIGLINLQNDKSLYLEFPPCPEAYQNDFVKKNVLPKMSWAKGNGEHLIKVEDAKDKITSFVYQQIIQDHEEYQFYTYYGNYDWVMFCGLFGQMVDLPKQFPMYTRDLKFLLDLHKINKRDLPKQVSGDHNALADARWNAEVYNYISTQTDFKI